MDGLADAEELVLALWPKSLPISRTAAAKLHIIFNAVVDPSYFTATCSQRGSFVQPWKQSVSFPSFVISSPILHDVESAAFAAHQTGFDE